MSGFILFLGAGVFMLKASFLSQAEGLTPCARCPNTLRTQVASGLQAPLEHQVEFAKPTAVKTAAPTVSFLFSQDWDSGSLPSPGCTWGCLAPGVPLGASSFGQRAQGQRLMGWCQKEQRHKGPPAMGYGGALDGAPGCAGTAQRGAAP